MKTRITYYRDDNLLVTDWFTIGPNFIIRSVIDTENNSLTIQEFDSSVIKIIDCPTILSAKKSSRLELLNLGVKLHGEIRNNGSILKPNAKE